MTLVFLKIMVITITAMHYMCRYKIAKCEVRKTINNNPTSYPDCINTDVRQLNIEGAIPSGYSGVVKVGTTF